MEGNDNDGIILLLIPRLSVIVTSAVTFDGKEIIAVYTQLWLATFSQKMALSKIKTRL